ncbi:MFS transporter [Streptomyces sp. SP17BM10]|uniref:MFS transporter n=1 Tax=Streptomyces sp. SP17BM10 TaxID=3002530 RepID=UPI002E78736A|nr:MFS transporter [Streptomyces sp. SP17BM10]MEE1783417.1 MFS transporter [Streptomyces sp. SP17BM10]
MPRSPVDPAVLRRRSVNRIVVLHGLSSFCYGMVFPFIGIHLASLPAVGTTGVAVYYGVSGLANLAVSLLLASAAVRVPRHALGILGLLLWLGCFLLLAGGGTLTGTAAAAVLGGAGQGCFMAAIIPIVNSLVPPEERRRVFARRYQVLNATLAGGSLVAGLFLTVFSDRAITWLLVANAVGYLPVALALALARRVPAVPENTGSGENTGSTESGDGSETAASDDRTGSLGVGLLIRASLGAALFQFGAYLFGYSQFEATAPLVADRLMDTGIGWVSVMLTLNVVVIVTLQRPITKLLEKRPEEQGLRIAVALWVAGLAAAGVTALGPGPLRLAGLLLYAMLFALGECAYSCSFHPWLISRVPERELTRANALCNSMMGIGMFFGPSIGVTLIGTGQAAWVWLPLAGLCGTVALTTVRRRRSRTATTVAPDPLPVG